MRNEREQKTKWESEKKLAKLIISSLVLILDNKPMPDWDWELLMHYLFSEGAS